MYSLVVDKLVGISVKWLYFLGVYLKFQVFQTQA